MFENASALRAPHAPLRRALACAALGLALVGGGAALAPASAHAGIGVGAIESALLTGERTITVSGTSSVSVVPDLARLSFSAQETASTAPEATEAVSATAQAVSEALAKAGVDEKDVQNSGVTLAPQYAYDSNGNASVTGYTASVDYVVDGVAVDDVADVLGAAVDAGISYAGSVQYYASTYDEAYEQALASALAQAKGKAQALADAMLADEDLVDVAGARPTLALTSVTEQGGSSRYRYADAEAYVESAATDNASGSAAKAIALVMQPGTIKIEAQVSCEYSFIGLASSLFETDLGTTTTSPAA